MMRLLCTLIILASAVAAQADPVADFYQGKQLKIIVGSAAGGGYDLYARALAREFGKHIPGQPTIIVQNQPGAGGILSVNQLYATGPFDGSVIGASVSGVPTATFLQTGANFDPTKLNWLGSITREAFVAFVWHTSPVKRIEDLKHTELTVGATTAGTTMVDYPMLLNNLLGYKFKIVRGYKGPPEINLAIQRGEIQGNGGVGFSVLKSLSQDWLSEQRIRILLQYNLEGVKELQGVPLATDLTTSLEEQQAMRLIFSRSQYSRPFFLPPNVPMDRVAALRIAFDAAVKASPFLAETERMQLDVDPMSGQDLQVLVAELATTPPSVIDRVKAALGSTADR